MKNFNIPPVWTLLAIVSSGLLHFVYPLTLFQF
ncbi:MAG: isoprenylcysteine carboxyl methyltransferase, partial [Rhodobacterales bacterium]|nr:isoprenylcysteine carboxyl methyltransferase [Rhodobacterales bacterium]